MICTTEDFVIPPLDVPNLNQVGDTFVDFIDETEEEVLRTLLGDALYTEFKLDFDTNGYDYLEERFRDLWDGVNYSYNGMPYVYKGLKAILKPYVKSQWLEKTFKSYNGAGITTPKAENGQVENPAFDIVTLNNRANRIAGDECRLCDTLYGFLYVNKDADYPNWRFKAIGRKNEFDL